MKKKFWNLKATANNTAELVLYGPISEASWWGDEITPKQFADDLNNLGDVQVITVRINSGGGDVFAGLAIHSMLKRHAAKVTVYVDGLAASIASIIAMAGDKIVMPKGSMMMIHNPWTSVMGADSKELRNMADVLDKIRDTLLDVYMDRTSMDKEEILAMVDKETWLSANDAVKKGFADEIEENFAISASIRGNEAFFNGIKVELSNFTIKPDLPQAPENNVPEVIESTIPTRLRALDLKLKEVL
jgi:ATP-dependent Clp protease protease subunit